jgi:SAM-dependent methyltransferase
LIDAALSVGGTYYLPYQPHGTPEQFHRAYPRAKELFVLKKKHDPDYKLRNTLWDKYYAPSSSPIAARNSEFHLIYSDTKWHDAFYRFLQNVYRIFPEDRFHTLIKNACAAHGDDESIYRYIQQRLSTIKPALSELFYAVPSLVKQKAEMARQTLELLGPRRTLDGYVEIGSTGRYASVLRKQLDLRGILAMVNDVPPTYSPVDIVERGRIAKLGAYVPLADYKPIGEEHVADASVDFVSCYIGLHHIAPPDLEPFTRSIARMLRPGGVFVLRDHDVTTPQMRALVSLAHAVFNAGLGVPWETNAKELRHFAPVAEWVKRLDKVGLRDTGKRLLQAHDPTDNVLMSFVKQ